jgi:hypothetical protein
MELIPVASSVIKLLLGWLPPVVLRWYYTQDRLSQLIYVDLMPRHESAMVNLGPAADFRVAMQVINLSPFLVELDRAVVRVTCGTSPLEALNVERRALKAGEVASVHFYNVIPDGQARQIVQNSTGSPGGIDGVFEFNCRVQAFTRRVPHLSGVRFAKVNEHLRQTDA